MLKWMLLAFFSFNLFALDISMQGARANFDDYSTLHIKDKDRFLCKEMINDFEEVIQIVCAFSKAPSGGLKPIQNDFFKIESQIKKKTFFLIITPFKKMKLYPVVFNLSQDDSVFDVNAELASHWVVVGYLKEVPFLKTQESSDVAINFPFFLDKNRLPYVGSLDIEGKPVHIKEVNDVSEYLKIKKLYAQKEYEKSLDLINEVIREYPSSLFRAELLYYKIKVNAKLEGNNDEVIELSKIYLREYSSDDNVAEVLSLIARAYSLEGVGTQADYFFDRLFSEHEESPFAKWGYIYKAQMLEESGAASKALSFYEKALNETRDIDIAATAAFKLAQYNIYREKHKIASEYAMKIVNAKPSFFVSKYEESLRMMDSFAQKQEYLTAAAIAQSLLDEINLEYIEYESLVKDVGIWLAKTSKKQEALEALNNYFETFVDGLFEHEVQVAKDSLFFDVSDANLSTKLADYDKLEETYRDDSIGKRAIYEKAKLMLENSMYKQVLESKDKLLELDATVYEDIQQIINDAAVGAMEEALKEKECHSVLKISTEYSIKLSDSWDDGIYECAMKGADFLLAKNIALKNLKSKDLEVRKKWLYRYIKVDFATGNYSDVLKASKDLVTLIAQEVDSEYKDVYRILFDTYQRLENENKMIETIVDIQRVYGDSYIDIERYIAVMAIGSQRNDDNLVIKYANEVMKIQEASSSYVQSPFVEFTLYQAYINKEDLNKALEVIKSLDEIKISNSNRARQKYLLGTVYEKLWRGEDAQRAYEDSIEADKDSAWAKLAKAAKESKL
ncbi:hypothetical protein M947_04210 [Sulfurimonas hongkongensis]|uniref:DUF7494 domain-containing protein n=1 Tax=Sulfurimonas hongkongensis TaxID=1172190 RepID=T0JNU7_9BACT|nr:hypothetical protein [Sulfurimonas hongkongensis]EQB39786.1 hypothetical protein M947_04210 [Sulfurimonas hongkongensis]